MSKHIVAGIAFPGWEKRTRVMRGPCSARLRGQPNRRILSTFVRGEYEYSLHATKGIRRRRIPQTAS